MAALTLTHQVGFSSLLHNRVGISSEAGSYRLIHWETQQRVCGCGAGELAESLPLPFTHSSERKLLFKGFSAAIVHDKYHGILKAFKKKNKTKTKKLFILFLYSLKNLDLCH